MKTLCLSLALLLTTALAAQELPPPTLAEDGEIVRAGAGKLPCEKMPSVYALEREAWNVTIAERSKPDSRLLDNITVGQFLDENSRSQILQASRQLGDALGATELFRLDGDKPMAWPKAREIAMACINELGGSVGTSYGQVDFFRLVFTAKTFVSLELLGDTYRGTLIIETIVMERREQEALASAERYINLLESRPSYQPSYQLIPQQNSWRDALDIYLRSLQEQQRRRIHCAGSSLSTGFFTTHNLYCE